MTQQNLNNGETLGVHRGKLNANFTELYSIKLESSQVLTLINTTVFTPTEDYHPATKLYADTLRSNWDSVFNPQNITADVFDRVNHTGFQDAITITQTVDYRFVSDTQIVLWNSKEDAIGTKNTAFNKAFGTTAGTVAYGDHIHTNYEPVNANIQIHITTLTGNPHQVTKTEVGLGNADNTSDANKIVSDLTQVELDLKQDSADLESDIEALVKEGNIPFPNFLPTKAITSNHTIDINSDYGLIIAAVTSDITITLPSLASLAGRPYQILEFIPVIANGFKVRIACQGSDTFPFGNTWFDLPASQKQFAIGLHAHGFNLRRNISVGIILHLTTAWGSANFQTPTGIPWDTETKNTQDELLVWSDTVNPERVTVQTSGEYAIVGAMSFDPQAQQDWEITAQIYVNGVAKDHMSLTTGGGGGNKTSLFGTGQVDLVAGDYVELKLLHSLTAAVNVISARFSFGIRL